jgi:hypothetical protein
VAIVLKRWVAGALAVGVVASVWGCTIDPGPNFVIPETVFNDDFFYCHVEPEYLFAPQTQCGAGQGSDNGNCHFNSSAVSGMALQQHAPIECDPDHPTAAGRANINTQAQSNFSAASLEMNRNCVAYQSCQAAILTRPTSNSAHPRQVVCDSANGIPCSGGADNPALPNVIYKWATTP